MIEYRQLEKGTASDVEVTTDDGDAEMVTLDRVIQECDFGIQLPSPGERDEDGNYRFIIPADAVGEFAECVFDIDNGKLEELIDQWNEDIIGEEESD